MDDSNKQTRRWPRQLVDIPVHVAIYDGAQRKLIPGRAADLSEGGMMLYAGITLHPGDLVEIEFQAPVSATVQGVIRYREGLTFGVEFVTPLGTDEKS